MNPLLEEEPFLPGVFAFALLLSGCLPCGVNGGNDKAVLLALLLLLLLLLPPPPRLPLFSLQLEFAELAAAAAESWRCCCTSVEVVTKGWREPKSCPPRKAGSMRSSTVKRPGGCGQLWAWCNCAPDHPACAGSCTMVVAERCTAPFKGPSLGLAPRVKSSRSSRAWRSSRKSTFGGEGEIKRRSESFNKNHEEWQPV